MRRLMGAPLRFSASRLIQAPGERVWRVLGDFGTEHRWTTSVARCERDTQDVRVGTVRTCRLPRPLMGRTEARETLVEYEPGRALAYELDGPAGPFARAGSRWSTAPAPGGGTLLTVEGRFEPKGWAARHLLWPLAKPMIRRLTRRVMAELDAHVQGTPA